MSLATAEKTDLPDFGENDSVRLEQIGSVICRVDSQRAAVVADYELVCKAIRSELRQVTGVEAVVNSQFDLAMVGWLKEYFNRERPDKDLPPTLIFECQEAPPTTWLGGFIGLRSQFLEMVVHSSGIYDASDAPDLRFETPDQIPLMPIYPEDSQQWWRQNGPLVV